MVGFRLRVFGAVVVARPGWLRVTRGWLPKRVVPGAQPYLGARTVAVLVRDMMINGCVPGSGRGRLVL